MSEGGAQSRPPGPGQALSTIIPRSTTTLLAAGNLPDHGCKPWEVDDPGTARLSPPGWAHGCPVMATGSEPGPGSSPEEEGEGSHPAAGVMSCFSPVSPALGLQPRKEEHRAKNFHGCVQQSKLTPDLLLIIAVGTGPGANVSG